MDLHETVNTGEMIKVSHKMISVIKRINCLVSCARAFLSSQIFTLLDLLITYRVITCTQIKNFVRTIYIVGW